MVEKEKCVLCGCETRVSKFMPIEFLLRVCGGRGSAVSWMFSGHFPG